jgi:hypothetical protein
MSSMGVVLEFPSSISRKTRQNKFSPGFVNLEFLRTAAQEMLRGWALKNGMPEKELPLQLYNRFRNLLERHVEGIYDFDVQPESEGWVLVFSSDDPDEDEGYGYSFGIKKRL